MLDPQTLSIFTAAALAILLTPGPAVLYVVNRSLTNGKLDGIVSTLGISLGGLVHVTAAVFGVSAILMSSSLAFSVVKYAGAAYLVYLGVKTLASRDDRSEPSAPESTTHGLRRAFLDGVIVNTLNPKAALFFFAFLPQFVDPSRGSATLQLLTLGMIFVSLGLLTDSLYAIAAGSISNILRSAPRVARTGRVAAGMTYLGLGVMAAFVERKA